MRILIAAKAPDDRRSIENRLHEIGFCPTAVFARGRETLVYIQHHPVDLVITTRRLQDMEGPALARAMELQGEGDVPGS